MKPKTKLQKHLAEIVNKLKDLTEHQIAYAKKHVFLNIACESRNTMMCTHCGGTWKVKDGKNITSTVCPHCGRKLDEVKHGSLRYREREYFCITFPKEGMQVIRYWLFDKHVKPGLVDYDWNEVGSKWIQEDGQFHDFCRARSTMPRYVDQWNFYSNIEYRPSSNLDYCGPGATLCYGMLPLLKRNGWNGKALHYNIDDVVRLLLTNPTFESLYKTKEYGFCSMMIRGCYDLRDPKWSRIIKLCRRHKRKIDDYHDWTDFKDYVEQLERHHYDIYNPKYLFPADFKAAHQHFIDLEREEAKERRRVEAEKRARAKENQRKWMAEYAPRFADMILTRDNITIKPLITYDDFQAESDVMEHCILTYYGKADTLLISIEYNGQKAETAEINLYDNDLIQCRGHHNMPTPHHREIVDFIKKSMDTFQKRYRKPMFITTLPAVILPNPIALLTAA